MNRTADPSKKFLEHIRVPVHILASNAKPISYQKNFKEDESAYINNYNILIQTAGINDSHHLSKELSQAKMRSAHNLGAPKKIIRTVTQTTTPASHLYGQRQDRAPSQHLRTDGGHSDGRTGTQEMARAAMS